MLTNVNLNASYVYHYMNNSSQTDSLAEEQRVDLPLIKKSLDWQQDLQLQSIHDDRKVWPSLILFQVNNCYIYVTSVAEYCLR